jgi:hypothetical protein
MGRASSQLTRHGPLIWSSIRPHDNDIPPFSCHHLVRHSTSFLSPLMPAPSRHPILGRGRRSMCLLPVFVRYQPRHRLVQWLLHVHDNVSHHAPTIVFAVIGRPFVFPAFALLFLPILLLAHGRSREPTDARQCGYDAGRKSVMLLAFRRACRRGGHGGACHA